MIKFIYKLSCSLNLQVPLNKISIVIYFENLIVILHVSYTFNTHVKFCVN